MGYCPTNSDSGTGRVGLCRKFSKDRKETKEMTSEITLTREEQQEIKELLNACKAFRAKMIEVGFQLNTPADSNRDTISTRTIVATDTIQPYLRECVMTALTNLFAKLCQANQTFFVEELLNKLTPNLERRYRVDYSCRATRSSYVTVHANSESEALLAFERSVENHSGEAWNEIVEDGYDEYEDYETDSSHLIIEG